MTSDMPSKESVPSAFQVDVEKTVDYAHLTNSSVRSFSFAGITVTVKDRQSGQPKAILNDVSGIVESG
jgi:hypothetical protein